MNASGAGFMSAPYCLSYWRRTRATDRAQSVLSLFTTVTIMVLPPCVLRAQASSARYEMTELRRDWKAGKNTPIQRVGPIDDLRTQRATPVEPPWCSTDSGFLVADGS